MPKNKRKGGGGRPMPPQSGEAPHPEEDDVASVMSVDSIGNTSVTESVPDPGAEEEVGVSTASTESKLLDMLELCSEKNASTRVRGLEGVRRLLQQHVFMLDGDWSHRETLLDSLERSLKRGKGREQVVAAMTLPLAVLQDAEGSMADSDRVVELLTLLRVTMTDTASAAAVRAACAVALSVLIFLRSTTAVSELDDALHALEEQFAGSFLKGDGSPPRPTPALQEHHNTALKAWLLLLTVASHSQFPRMHKEVLGRLPGLLLSNSVDLRITTGEAIALLLERFRDAAEEDGSKLLKIPNRAALLESLEELANDGSRGRAKADRRRQRSSFRDILCWIRKFEMPAAERIRFGIGEELMLEDWAGRRVYESLCDILSGGISRHLKENEVVRDIFSLGPPLMFEDGDTAAKGPNRHERRLVNQAVAKDRYQRRSQHRDKRFVF